MSVIANTTVISNFAAVEQLELLHTRFGILYISDHVFEEIQNGLTQGYTFYANLDKYIFPFSETGWLHLISLNTSDEFQMYGNLLSTLHGGEASCLSIAFHRKWTLLSDDKEARKIGKELNIPISGTLGILLSLVRRKLLSIGEADTVLQHMIQRGYYSPVASLQEILHE
jgi:predicted nucleic acid-binding protein